MKNFWIMVPAIVFALTVSQAASASPGCGKDKAVEGGATFGAEQGGCPHAKAAAEKAGDAKAGGEATCQGHGDCENCPMHKEGKCACADKDGKDCGCGCKDGKDCACKDCPHKKDGTCPHAKADAVKTDSKPQAPPQK